MTFPVERPYLPILLEIEEAVTRRGETRPLIVEQAYRKIIAEWGANLTEAEQTSLGAFRLIMEQFALRNQIQAEAAAQIVGKSAIQRWGLNTVPNWANLTTIQQTAALFTRLSPSSKERVYEDIISKEGKPQPGSTLKWDFPDVDDVRNKIAKVFFEDIIAQESARAEQATIQ
jgi:hypothetical protein